MFQLIAPVTESQWWGSDAADYNIMFRLDVTDADSDVTCKLWPRMIMILPSAPLDDYRLQYMYAPSIYFQTYVLNYNNKRYCMITYSFENVSRFLWSINIIQKYKSKTILY